MNKRNLKKVLRQATGCTIQHDGWTCGTCFFEMGNGELTIQDWQAVLLKRGDYTRDILDNLPDDIEASLEKVYRLAQEA